MNNGIGGQGYRLFYHRLLFLFGGNCTKAISKIKRVMTLAYWSTLPSGERCGVQRVSVLTRAPCRGC